VSTLNCACSAFAKVQLKHCGIDVMSMQAEYSLIGPARVLGGGARLSIATIGATWVDDHGREPKLVGLVVPTALRSGSSIYRQDAAQATRNQSRAACCTTDVETIRTSTHRLASASESTAHQGQL